ncbi:tetratricopeptide repeat protein [Leeuwenhoekiella sp. W20_SRS_FM14]|uniref:tetratricopeptide repeat protein n=1 Tax=Leeuwenhoekiella sp. W20_SRS_FM14 TaxID=3240270 RepID=UPI003F99E983
MKKTLLFLNVMLGFFAAFAQEEGGSQQDILLSQLSKNACECIDAISTYDKHRAEVALEINKCLDELAGAYQMGSKFQNINPDKDAVVSEDGKQKIDIVINTNKESDEYKDYYYTVERYMMQNCMALKETITSNDKQSDKSLSENRKAYMYYVDGVDASENEEFAKAAAYFEKAVKEDPDFAFAWDNLGLMYRKLNKFDEAIAAYESSIQVDPYGLMPLQNIAIVYQYKEDYANALKSYERLAAIDASNPEVFYGIGTIYALKLNENEKGLEAMCKAYKRYIELKSPYRADAEKVMRIIYAEMKEAGNEAQFNQILEANDINTD